MTLVELLEVLAPFEDVLPIFQRVVGRLEREGVRGMTSMQFWADREARELGAVISFSDPSQMLAHTAMVSSWDDFQRFVTMTRVKEIRIHGRLTPEVEAWIGQFNGPTRKFEEHIAGFVR